MKHLLSILVILVVLVLEGRAQTFSTGDYQINRKKATAGFEVAELLAGSNVTLTWDDTAKTVTIASTGGGGGGTWGTITGTLSAQTDLQNALNAKLNASAVSAFGLTLIDDATAADARNTLGLGTLATQSATITDYLTTSTAASTYQPLDSDLTSIAALTTTAFGRGLLTETNASTARTTLGLVIGTNVQAAGNYITALTGDVTASGPGSVAATIANDAVTNAKLANMAANTLKGRVTASTGDPEDITLAGLTEETTPATGDFLLGWESGGNLRKFDIGDLPGGGSTTFTGLTDTPSSYASQALKFVRVNAGETALEFVTSSSSLADGNYGDVTVSSGGTVISFSSNVWTGTVQGLNAGGGLLSMTDQSTYGAAAGNVNTNTGFDGASADPLVTGGDGGTIDTTGGNADGGGGPMADQNASGGNGGNISAWGGDAFINGTGAWAGGHAGTLNMNGGDAVGGAAGLAGGSINTSEGGGSINTRGTGLIELGATGTRTNIVGNASSDWTLTLPTGAGSNGQVLTTNGSGTTSWTAPSSATGVYRTVWLPAAAWIPRTTNGAGVDSRETATNKVNTDELLFDAAAIEYAQIILKLDTWDVGTVKAKVVWTVSTGSGDAVFTVSGVAISNDDALDAAQGTAQSVTDTVTATGDVMETAATPAITIGGTPAADDTLILELARNATSGSDTLAADARVLGVWLQYKESTTSTSAW